VFPIPSCRTSATPSSESISFKITQTSSFSGRLLAPNVLEKTKKLIDFE
jgi:hypothetical protein